MHQQVLYTREKMISLGSRLIACCKLAQTLARHMWRHNYVIDRNEYLIFTLSESINPWVYSHWHWHWHWVFTARCTLVQSAVLRWHVVCLSVRLSVTLVDCDHIGWNSSKLNSPLVSLGCSLFATPTWRVCSKGNTPKFGPKVTHPLLIWASETFDRKLWPNGYR